MHIYYISRWFHQEPSFRAKTMFVESD